MRKLYSFLSLAFIFFSIHVYSQVTYSSLEDALLSASKLSGTGMPASINWMENGSKYSFKDADGVIKLYDPASGKETTLFDPSKEKFPGTDKAFKYSSFQWSKDFKFIVFVTNTKPVWRNSGYSDYYLYSIDNKTLTLIAEQAYTAQLSPDGSKIGYERKGNLFYMKLADSKEIQLMHDTLSFFYNGRFGWAYEEEFGLVQGWQWSNDGNSIAYWQSDERKVPLYRFTDYGSLKDNYSEIPYPRVGDQNPLVRIGVLDIEKKTNQWMKVDCGDGYIPRIYWTSVQNQLAIVQLNRKQNHMQLYFADTRSGDVKKIFEEQEKTWLEVFSFGAGIMHYFYFPENKKEFFWKSERDGWSHIYRYDYNGKLINQVTSGNWEVIKVLKTDDEKQKLYYTSTETSPLENHLYVIDFDGKNKKRLTQAAGNHTINFGGQYYIDSYSSTTQPKQVNICNENGEIVKKLRENKQVSEFISTHTYAPQLLEKFVTSDGQNIDISIIKPIGFDPSKKYPVLFDVYGGPCHESVHNEFATDPWHQYLAQAGYVIVKVNNRGSGGYGAAFKKIVYGKLGYWECFDFAEAAKYMASKSWVDANRIAIRGHSYGGFTAAYSILNYPGIFKVALVAAPVSDWRNYDAIYTERFMGVLPENKTNYDESAVLMYTNKLKGKMLIAHSTFDDNVHIQNSMQLIRSFVDNGIDVDQRIYQGGGHGIAYNNASYQLLFKQYTNYLTEFLK